MEKKYLSIGKMAELNHVSVPTLRLYDEIGLLKPYYVDPKTGYRYYDICQNARLDIIIYMKELGMNLSEISSALENGDLLLIEQILMKKNEQIHAQIRELKLRHNAVERAMNAIERYRKSPAPGTTVLEYIDRRFVLGLPCTENFYESDIRSYEKAITALREFLKQEGLAHIHTYNIGTSIEGRNFCGGQFSADRIFAFVDEQVRDTLTHPEHLHVLDSGMYACIYLDRYEDEIECGQKLLSFCNERGYTIAGDYICEVMTEFNVFSCENRSMFLRLQVPLKF